jgi:hypothetical protein
VAFIFSHSALKEGWDNPNVFQICTLREVGSETERRQQVGRGVRLPVDAATGDRIQDGVRASPAPAIERPAVKRPSALATAHVERPVTSASIKCAASVRLSGFASVRNRARPCLPVSNAPSLPAFACRAPFGLRGLASARVERPRP